MQYAYDRQGNVTGLTYPNGTKVNVAFNLAGWPSRAQPSAVGWLIQRRRYELRLFAKRADHHDRVWKWRLDDTDL
jgi:hypothetical protein